MTVVKFGKSLIIVLALSFISAQIGQAGEAEDLAEIKLATQKLYQKYYQNLAQTKVIYQFKSWDGPKDVKVSYEYEEDFVESLKDTLLEREPTPQALDEEQQKYEAEFKRDLERVAQSEEHTLAVAQEAMNRLHKVLTNAKNDDNQKNIEYLNAVLFPLKAENLKFDFVGLGAEVAFNEKTISLSHQLGRDFPEATLLMILAHELGHGLSLPNFLGYYFPQIKDKKLAYHLDENQSKVIAQKAQAAQGHQVKDYPFWAALEEYRKLGISGLDYIEPNKAGAFDQLVQKLLAKMQENDDLILIDDNGPEITVVDKARLIPALVISNAITFDETGLAEELTEGKLEKYVSRIDEVLADHFAKLVLEDKAAEIKDPAARKKFVEEGLLLFFAIVDSDEAVRWHKEYPALMLPECKTWWEKSQHPQNEEDVAQAQIWQDTWQEYFVLDEHPNIEERLKIFLSSPILRQAVLGNVE